MIETWVLVRPGKVAHLLVSVEVCSGEVMDWAGLGQTLAHWHVQEPSLSVAHAGLGYITPTIYKSQGY